jgi:hypothetical protein
MSVRYSGEVLGIYCRVEGGEGGRRRETRQREERERKKESEREVRGRDREKPFVVWAGLRCMPYAQVNSMKFNPAVTNLSIVLDKGIVVIHISVHPPEIEPRSRCVLCHQPCSIDGRNVIS